jgi:hypothetical protein
VSPGNRIILMLEEKERQRWATEFKELGLDRVRSQLMGTRWAQDKRVYARQWVERQDVRAWQDKKPAGASPKRGLAGLRSYKKLWGAIAGIMFGGYALIRVIGRFKGY